MKNLENHIFPALSRALQSASTPMGGEELFALPEINAHAPNVSRLSAYLDRLWRDGHLYRVLQYSPHFGGSTWAYNWKGPSDKSVQSISLGAEPGSPAVAKKKGAKAIEKPTVVISVQQKSTGFQYLDELKKGFLE